MAHTGGNPDGTFGRKVSNKNAITLKKPIEVGYAEPLIGSSDTRKTSTGDVAARNINITGRVSANPASEMSHTRDTDSLDARPHAAMTRKTGSNRSVRETGTEAPAPTNQLEPTQGRPMEIDNQQQEAPGTTDTGSRKREQRPGIRRDDRDKEPRGSSCELISQNLRSEDTMESHLPIDGENAAGSSQTIPTRNK